MSRRRKSNTASASKQKKNNSGNYEISGVILLAFGIFAFISLLGGGTGIVGKIVNDGSQFLFGTGAIIAIVFLIIFGARYALLSRGMALTAKKIQWGLLYFLTLCMIHHYYVPSGRELDIEEILRYGGITGGLFTYFSRIALGEIGTTILLIGLIVINILLLFHWSIARGVEHAGEKTEGIRRQTKEKLEDVAQKIRDKKAAMDAAHSAARLEELNDKPTEFIYNKKKSEPKDLEDDTIQTDVPFEEKESCTPVLNETDEEEQEKIVDDAVNEDESVAEPSDMMETNEIHSEENPDSHEEEPHPPEDSAGQKEVQNMSLQIADKAEIQKPEYQFPPLSLLHTDGSKGNQQIDVSRNAGIIESTLKSFGVMAKVVHASVGPTVTRFELHPEVGVRVSKIQGLSNELAMALAATHIRIEAPIPGKAAVGIEIPNNKSASVPLRDVLDSDNFKNGKGHILVALGKDITGKTIVTDLSQMPHLLIAGSTGSGKSVCINSIITSIIYHSKPEDVKLILIDPKVVELSVYNGIPHLRTEVITNMKMAEGALNWAVREMEARYQLFASSKVRNIDGYNKLNSDKKMPYILIIVDEFADLMNVAAKEVEVLIQRLTQKARAAGIHLILATQRPSADVITGVIKSNIPSRIAFMVESALNSRIILDEGGAETLLGKGDMLFKQAGKLNTIRVQGAFISDEEVESVVNYVREESIKQEQGVVTYEPIDLSVPEETHTQGMVEEEQDEVMEEAVEWVLDTKRASVSALQRRFRIGYTRAGRLMDTMERLGIVSPADGAKPREILMTKEQALSLLQTNKNGADSSEEKDVETESDE